MLVLMGENLADTVEGVDFMGGLVGAKANDAGESQGETAVVAMGTLDIVKSDFHDDERINGADVPVVFDGVGQEIGGEFADFGVGHPGIGFANVDEAIGIANGKSVVGEQTAAFAVAVFGSGDDDVQRGERTFELNPE